MSKIQYVPDKESPFIKKLYGKEDDFKVETLTFFGTLYELEKLQNQIEVLEKALELACEELYDSDCISICAYCPYNIEDECADECPESIKILEKYFETKAKEMMKRDLG